MRTSPGIGAESATKEKLVSFLAVSKLEECSFGVPTCRACLKMKPTWKTEWPRDGQGQLPDGVRIPGYSNT